MILIRHLLYYLRISILWFFLPFSQLILSQSQIAFSHLSIEDGLSQNSVISIAQDSIGYMWFATQDGLNRYDGFTFKTYDKQFEDITRPNFSHLGKIYIDKTNRLWIITNSGKLELYNPKEDDFKLIDKFNAVSAIFQDELLNLYIGTYGKGVFKIDAKSKDTIQILKPSDVNKTINSFFQSKLGLLVATNGAVFKIDDDGKYINVTPAYNTVNFSAIEQSKNGDLWVGSYGHGLFIKKNNEITIAPFTNQQITENLNIEDLLIDDEDRLWVTTYGTGAFLLDIKNNKTLNFLENKTNPFAIHYNDMLCLYQDNTGIVWLGSDGAGLSYYDKHLIKFNVLTNKQMPKSVNIDVVRSIASDENQNIWIGTSGKGLTFVDIEKNIYKTLTIANSNIASNRIISLNYIDNSLWIGHQGSGLNILESSGKINYFEELSKDVIWKIVTYNREKSWLCTESKGLILFDKNTGIVEIYNTENSNLTSNNIRTIVYGNNEELWMATENNGVFKLNQKTNNITKIEKLQGPIKSLFFKNDILWVGTFGNGLKRFEIETGDVTNYTVEDGLPNNVIYGILSDDDDNLWLSSNLGLTKFKLEKNGEPSIENYNNYDGLQALEFNTGAYYKAPNGTLYFGGLDGINWFHPNQLTLNTVKPKTVINNLDLFNKPIEIIPNKTFKHNQNTLTFTFSSLHFSQPERNQFKYRLINNDADWIHSKNAHIAHYTNLPPNDYEFQVISSNYDGIWNTTPATFKFKILKPWYFSNISKALYALLILFFAFVIYKYLKWRWEIKAQLQIEHTETERLKNLDELKTKLYANVSHEFRTPLTLILDPIENQLSKKNISSRDKMELSLVHRNAKRLLNLVSQLMDLSKLEAGSLKLNVSKNDLSPFVKQLVSAFKYNIKKKKIDFSYHIADIRKVWFDKDAIEKIITNLLSNSLKYTPKNGRIIFEINRQNDHVIITILNNGSKINPKNINKLFNRYYRGHSEQEGSGIGLALVKELVTLSNGSIVANVINSDDIQFTITLPITKAAYKTEDIIEKPVKDKSTNKKTKVKHKLLQDRALILIVEDDKDIRDYLKSCLENSYKIITAANGKRGITKAIKNIPDLIISDVMMPMVNGIELCNTLKIHELTSHIPIILLTAKGDDESELEGLEAMADDYMTKPFKSRILETRIANLIALRKALQSRYSQNIAHEVKDIAITSLDEKFLNKVESVLHENLTDSSFDAENFSKKMLMSRMQLHRKLKALTGLSTTEFIRSQRLKCSMALLQKSGNTISEIAYQTGFSTPSYFIKCFKKSYHCTPTEYQNKA